MTCSMPTPSNTCFLLLFYDISQHSPLHFWGLSFAFWDMILFWIIFSIW
jgi:hypothetical protein